MTSLKERICETCFESIMLMMMRDNFYHADLHAGNVMYHKPKSADERVKVTILDCGLIAEVEPRVRRLFGKWLSSIAAGSLEACLEGIYDMNIGKGPFEKEVFRIDIAHILKKFVGAKGLAPDGTVLRVSDLFGEILHTCQDHGVIFRADIATTLLSMNISDGLLRSLNPNFDICSKAMPYVMKYSISDASKTAASTFYTFIGQQKEKPNSELDGRNWKTFSAQHGNDLRSL
eukprot:TRINITY_DN903_c0_g1_i1.p1 TRINITY_DN903_c0_g1~~TRINITY_DN903_c0_g1_i1.p1  ORF type:complete len:232 (+),score=33.18 TRINITY_DN903_c0_g1_i1:69-764(+)